MESSVHNFQESKEDLTSSLFATELEMVFLKDGRLAGLALEIVSIIDKAMQMLLNALLT